MGALAHSIVNKLLHPPTVRVKEAANEEEGMLYANSLRVLFGLNGTAPTAPAPADVGDAPAPGAATGPDTAEATERDAAGATGPDLSDPAATVAAPPVAAPPVRPGAD